MRFSLAAIFIGTAAAAMVGGQGSGGHPAPTGSMSHPAGDSRPTGGHGDQGQGPPPLITSTIYTTRESTVYACPSTVTDCPVESKTAAAVVTDTIVLGTTICPLTLCSTPIQSAQPYYSNAASSLAGGAMAIGAAALAVLAL
jgi:hypothetical protein